MRVWKRMTAFAVTVLVALSVSSCGEEASPSWLADVPPSTVAQTTTTLVTTTTVTTTTTTAAPTTQPTTATTQATAFSPYTVTLEGATWVYQQPSFDSLCVQSVGEDGIYTIVEEAWDSTGRLWGRLRSGIGWVALGGNDPLWDQFCPQCGTTDPIRFPDDWQPGDVCFGCNHYNFHFGEGGGIFCAQCGADCSYRGVMENGLCEDCYYGS